MVWTCIWSKIQVYWRVQKVFGIYGRRNNASERKISMPKEHLEAVLSLSIEFGFEIVITDEVLVV